MNCDKERPARLVKSVSSKVEEQIVQQLQDLFRIQVRLRIQVKYKGKMYVPTVKVLDSNNNN